MRQRRIAFIAAMVVGPIVASSALARPSVGVGVPRHGPPTLALTSDQSDFGGIATEDSADVDNDGYVDVIITRHRWRTLDTFPMQVLLNNRRGGYVDGTAAIFEGPPPRLQWPRKVVIADFNNDGRPDIFVADHGYDDSPGPGFQNTLVLSTPRNRLRDATGNLPPRIRFTHSATAADVDRDGSLDLYIGSNYTEARKEPPEIMLNDGTGTFRACPDCLPPLVTTGFEIGGFHHPGYTYTASQFVDVDNDRDPDLVLAGNGFYPVHIPPFGVWHDNQLLVNDGRGRFSVKPGAMPARPWNNTAIGLDIRATDLDRDGFQDLAIAYTQDDPYYLGNQIQLLLNNRDGTFRDDTDARIQQSPEQRFWITQLTFVELTGDSRLDLIGEFYEGARTATSFYANDGSGRFTLLPSGYGNVVNNDFALVDAKGDGHRDLLTTDDYGYPTIRHYLVRELGPPQRPGAVSGVRVTRDAASRRPVVAWPYVWGAARYEIWRSGAARKAGTKIATTRLLRFVDKTALRDRRYYYSVRAVNAAGVGGLSVPPVTRVGP